MSDSHGIRKRAVRFYEELYKSELLHDKADNVFLENLPQLSEEANGELGKALTLEELEKSSSKYGMWESTWT